MMRRVKHLRAAGDALQVGRRALIIERVMATDAAGSLFRVWDTGRGEAAQVMIPALADAGLRASVDVVVERLRPDDFGTVVYRFPAEADPVLPAAALAVLPRFSETSKRTVRDAAMAIAVAYALAWMSVFPVDLFDRLSDTPPGQLFTGFAVVSLAAQWSTALVWLATLLALPRILTDTSRGAVGRVILETAGWAIAIAVVLVGVFVLDIVLLIAIAVVMVPLQAVLPIAALGWPVHFLLVSGVNAWLLVRVGARLFRTYNPLLLPEPGSDAAALERRQRLLRRAITHAALWVLGGHILAAAGLPFLIVAISPLVSPWFLTTAALTAITVVAMRQSIDALLKGLETNLEPCARNADAAPDQPPAPQALAA